MDANEYQRLAGRTLIDKPDFQITMEQASITQDALLLAVAAGQIADLVKKGIYHQHGLDRAKLRTALLLLSAAARSLDDAAFHGEYSAPETLEDHSVMLAWNALGLAGESGEVVEVVHDMAFKGLPGDPTKEAGDALWYIAALCTKVDVTLSEVMERNVQKLVQRYPEGYSSERSLNRERHE